MANTYVINSCQLTGNTLLVQGTVNGTGVSVAVLNQTFANALLWEAYVALFMLAALPLTLVTQTSLQGLNWSA